MNLMTKEKPYNTLNAFYRHKFGKKVFKVSLNGNFTCPNKDGKSGVGGGIVAVVPNVMSISVFSPRLNSWGNSLAGTKALELFTNKTGHSIF